MIRIYDKDHHLIATAGEELDVKIPMEKYLRIREQGEYTEEGEYDFIELCNQSCTHTQ